jgi:CHASE3 domain sensor protein
VAFLALAGCGKSEQPPSKDIGQQTADIAADTALMREASAAVNEVIRNATDCDAARTAIPAANAKLDEAERRVRTTTGRTTLDGLRQQVKRVAEVCP